MSKFFTLFAVLIALSFTTPALAETALKDQIAVLDVQKIMRESKAAKSLKSQMESKQKSFKKEVESQDKKLRSAQESLKKEQAVLSAEAFAKKRKSFESKIGKAQKDLQSRKGSLDKKFLASMEKIQKTMLDITSDVAKEKNLIIVLPRSQVVLVAGGMDITDDVLKQLDKKLSKVSLK